MSDCAPARRGPPPCFTRSSGSLRSESVPIHLIADNAAGHLMMNGKVDIVLYGADRVAAKCVMHRLAVSRCL